MNKIYVTMASYYQPKLVCYFTNWSQYREDAEFTPEDIDVSLCTHVIYAFAKVKNGVLVHTDDNDIKGKPKGMYERVTSLKKSKPDLKVLLSVGGWVHGSKPFTDMVETPQGIKHFTREAVKYLKRHNFDGLDVDWEYPTMRGSPPEDRNNFTRLMKELKTTLQSEQLLLTAAVSAAGQDVIEAAYDVRKLAECVDFFCLMAYDFQGKSKTGLCSPLPEQEKAVGHWVDKGAAADQIVLGCAMYGRSFTLKNSHDNEIGADVKEKGEGGELTREPGMLAYYEIAQRLSEGTWKAFYHPVQKACYAYKGNQWVGYDDPDSIKEKARYIRRRGLAGAMVWSLDLDDFRGKRYPLLRAMHEELNK